MTGSMHDEVERFRAALAAEDGAAIEAVIRSVGDERLDELLDALDAAGLDVPDSAPAPELLEQSLADRGLARPLAAQLSVFTAGGLPEFVRRRAAALGVGADTVLERIESASSLDDADSTSVHVWLDAVLAGDEPPFELDAPAVQALATMLDATDATITSLIDRG